MHHAKLKTLFIHGVWGRGVSAIIPFSLFFPLGFLPPSAKGLFPETSFS